jgi:hypothetical protein
MKIPLKTKKFGHIFFEEWSLSKTILFSVTGMVLDGVFCVTWTRLLDTFSSNAALPYLYGHSSKQRPELVLPIFWKLASCIDLRFMTLIRVGALDVIWTLWLCRNDKKCSLLQVLYRCTCTLRLWSPLRRMENRDLFMEVYTRLEATMGDIFPHMGGLPSSS